MKKVSLIAFIFFFLFMIVGCDKQEIIFTSNPIGYAVVSDEFVAKGSFIYHSDAPYNVNQISMELYYLPSVWGEIEVAEDQVISENDPDLVIIDYNTPNQKVFAKYIFIGEDSWEAQIDNNKISYINQDGDDILEVLADEEKAKLYVEALVAQNAYFLNNEMVMLNGYSSKFDTTGAGDVYQKVNEVQVVNITWAETNSNFPDLSTNFPDYDEDKVNTLYQRVFEKAENAEFRTSIYSKKS